MDPLYWRKRGLGAEEQTEGLGLFSEPAVEPLASPVPDIESPPPSAPGSESSERAADAALRFRKGQNFTVMRTLAALPIGAVISREEISERTGIRESSLCARLSELAPVWVEVLERACTAKSGVTVNGYRLTDAGRARMRDRGAA